MNIIWLIFLFEYILLSSLVLSIWNFKTLLNSGEAGNLASEFNGNASSCSPFSMCLVWSCCILLLFVDLCMSRMSIETQELIKKKGCGICQSPILHLMWYPCSLYLFSIYMTNYFYWTIFASPGWNWSEHGR